MKLGNTRDEMQRNYSEIILKSRKVGKIMAIIGAVSSFCALKMYFDLGNAGENFTTERMIMLTFVFLCPMGGYIGGHMYYYGFRRMADWLEKISEGDADPSGCLFLMAVFPGIGTIILYIVAISLFFMFGMYVGLFDWIKIHIDGKRYNLKVIK